MDIQYQQREDYRDQPQGLQHKHYNLAPGHPVSYMRDYAPEVGSSKYI